MTDVVNVKKNISGFHVDLVELPDRRRPIDQDIGKEIHAPADVYTAHRRSFFRGLLGVRIFRTSAIIVSERPAGNRYLMMACAAAAICMKTTTKNVFATHWSTLRHPDPIRKKETMAKTISTPSPKSVACAYFSRRERSKSRSSFHAVTTAWSAQLSSRIVCKMRAFSRCSGCISDVIPSTPAGKTSRMSGGVAV